MLKTFEHWLERALRFIAYAGGLVLVGLMLLIVYEVLMRYFFGRPFRGGYEITELAMAVIVACGLPYTAIARGHVFVDVFARWLDRPSLRWLTAAIHLMGAILLAVVAWRSAAYAMGSYQWGDVSNMMRIPKYPFQFGVAVAAGLFSLVLLLDTIKALAPASPEQKPEIQ